MTTAVLEDTCGNLIQLAAPNTQYEAFAARYSNARFATWTADIALGQPA